MNDAAATAETPVTLRRRLRALRTAIDAHFRPEAEMPPETAPVAVAPPKLERERSRLRRELGRISVQAKDPCAANVCGTRALNRRFRRLHEDLLREIRAEEDFIMECYYVDIGQGD